MKRKTRKAMSLILAIVFIIALLPTFALAAEAEPSVITGVTAMTQEKVDAVGWAGSPAAEKMALVYDVDDTTITASGELIYSAGFTGFASSAELQEGYYAALYIPVTDAQYGVASASEGTVFALEGELDIEFTAAEAIEGQAGGYHIWVYMHRTAPFNNFTMSFDWDGNGSQYALTPYTVDMSAVTAKTFIEAIVAAPMVDQGATPPEDVAPTDYAVAESEGEISITATGVPLHTNGQGTAGYWAGAAFEIAEAVDGFKYYFGADPEGTVGATKQTEFTQIGGAGKYISFYTNAGQAEPKTVIKLELYKGDDLVEAAEYTYDLSGVTIESNIVDIAAAPMVDQGATPPKDVAPTDYAVAESEGEIAITATGVPEHKNGEQTDGYWVGVAFEIGDEVDGFKYAFSATEVTAVTSGLITEFDEIEGEEGKKFICFYPNAGAESPKKYIMLELYSESVNIETVSYELDLTNVTIAEKDAFLKGLTLSVGTLTPAFDKNTMAYTARVGMNITEITVTPTVNTAGATVKVNGAAVQSGTASAPIALNFGSNAISVVCTAKDGTTTKTYRISVTRAAPEPEPVPGGGGGSGASAVTYIITASAGTGGTISPTGNVSVLAGTDRVFTITPDAGYDVADVLVDGVSVGAVTTYTFTRVAKVHTIAATFIGKTPTSGMPFNDVGEEDWFYNSVYYVYVKEIMSGTGATTFSPNAETTRAMIWTILARISGLDTDGGANWYSVAQQWAMDKGVTDGTNPEATVTREQLVTMLYRFAQLMGYDTTQGGMAAKEFGDYGDISSWAEEAMIWAVSAGIINGTSTTTLSPQGMATRAEVAAMIERFCEKIIKK